MRLSRSLGFWPGTRFLRCYGRQRRADACLAADWAGGVASRRGALSRQAAAAPRILVARGGGEPSRRQCRPRPDRALPAASSILAGGPWAARGARAFRGTDAPLLWCWYTHPLNTTRDSGYVRFSAGRRDPRRRFRRRTRRALSVLCIVDDHGPLAARCARRPEAGASPHPARDAAAAARSRVRVQEMRPRRRRRD